MSSYFARWAHLPGGLAENVGIEVQDGRFGAVTSGATPGPADIELAGVVLPGFANTHSHAFHRALRGRTHGDRGTFWTWRQAMYAVADRLTPDRYFNLALAVFAEMALSGVTCVGEFHYVHHQVDGTPYADPNAMGLAVIGAAKAAGIRITLLDTCYLAGGLADGAHLPLEPRQRRFGDGDAAGWAARFGLLTDTAGARIGAAIHSVRAVPADQIPTVVGAAAGRPLHVHLSEQPAENEQCLQAYGRTPTALLDRLGAVGPNTTAVHATHLSSSDIDTLGRRGCSVSFCPTTERDLADGFGPARALAAAGARLSLGSDQNAIVDLIEEARALEMHERLTSGNRGRFSPVELLTALTGHTGLGWRDAGRIEVGARADLVEIDPHSVRTAGSDPGQILLAAGAPDVRTVIVDGRAVVQDGRHRLGDIGALLGAAIEELR